jgi:hypothetical protein
VNAADEQIRQAMLTRIPNEIPPVVVENAPAFSADPQRSIRRCKQRQYAVVRESRCVGAIENDESQSVETGESARRTDPKITIGGLRDSLDATVRKSVLHPPDSLAIFLICANRGRNGKDSDRDEAEHVNRDTRNHVS